MDTIGWLFAIANIGLFIGSLELLKKVFTNRSALKDYSWFGSIVTFLCLLLFQYIYFFMNNWISFIFCIPTTTLWLLASYYSLKQKFK